MNETPKAKEGLTESEKALIERNKQKAILLRQSRLASSSNIVAVNTVQKTTFNNPSSNSGGGFFIEEPDTNDTNEASNSIVFKPGPILLSERPNCEICQTLIGESFLLSKFDLSVCDGCRDKTEKHSLITKTDALKEYLLKDCDLDKREPPLRYIIKKNPHACRGDMKLYLRCQVETRALLVWESEEALEEAHDKRIEERERRKQKAYDKKVKALRMEVRSSLFRMDRQKHQHVYGEEAYNDKDDLYYKICETCQHKLSYEKM